MVVINDVATIADIHPPDKQTVGERLADVALGRLHGKDVDWRSPRFREMEIVDGALRVTFDHAGKGLRTRDGQRRSWSIRRHGRTWPPMCR